MQQFVIQETDEPTSSCLFEQSEVKHSPAKAELEQLEEIAKMTIKERPKTAQRKRKDVSKERLVKQKEEHKAN